MKKESAHKGKSDRTIIDGRCPVCGGNVMVTAMGYKCTNPNCHFFIKGVMADRRIRRQEAEDFLLGRNIPIDGFYCFDSKTSFPAYLRYDPAKGTYLDAYVGKCPVCGGAVRIGKKAFNCSNYNSQDNPCHFFIYRNIAGHEMSYNEVREILSQGCTGNALQFYDNQGKCYLRKVAFNPKKNISFIK